MKRIPFLEAFDIEEIVREIMITSGPTEFYLLFTELVMVSILQQLFNGRPFLSSYYQSPFNDFFKDDLLISAGTKRKTPSWHRRLSYTRRLQG